MNLHLAPGHPVGPRHPVFVIAELGQNHGGDFHVAAEMIKVAKASGADCVKLQKSSLPHRFTKKALLRPYDSKHSFGATYGEHRAHLELSHQEFRNLQKLAMSLSIPFTSSAMDKESADFLMKLQVPFIKIGSGDSNNSLLLEHVAKNADCPLVVSTGMSDWSQVTRMRSIFEARLKSVVFLQCTSAYPCPSDSVHLRVLPEMAQRLKPSLLGYSGHEEGYISTLGAVALGATVIERHFTLDKKMKGSDHACSLDPIEFAEMVKSVRVMESSLGSSEKTFQKCEEACFSKLGKSVVTTTDLIAGTVLAREHLDIKVSEPAGLSGSHLDELIGRRLRAPLLADESLQEHHLHAP